MQIVPTRPVPNQTFQVLLAEQPVVVNAYQLSYGLFMDVLIGDTLIVAGAICENRNRIVRSAYLGFVGDLAFVDQQGSDDPIYTGLGTRFLLVYLEEADLAGLDS